MASSKSDKQIEMEVYILKKNAEIRNAMIRNAGMTQEEWDEKKAEERDAHKRAWENKGPQ